MNFGGFLSKMMDFLTFKSFISTEILIIFYYIGAIMMPVGAWLFVTWLVGKYNYVDDAYRKAIKTIWKSVNKKQQAKLVAIFVSIFLFMEAFWRMMFEFLIAYLQIRDALLQ